MTRPIVGAFAERLFARLGELTDQDEELGWPLLTYLGAISDNMLEDLYQIVIDQEDGTPGWGILLDPFRCPYVALPWLAQLVGVDLDTNLTEDDQRNTVAQVGGWRRGSPGSMISAAYPYLTGTRQVILVERYGGDAYQLLFVTKTAETPTGAQLTAMQNSVMAQKPAGIILTFSNVIGLLWQDVNTEWPTWGAVNSNYATWNDVRNGP